MTLHRRVVFLDRDGVVTIPTEVRGKGYAPLAILDLRFYDDAADSVSRLKAAGFDVVIVTNQPDVSAGPITLSALDQIPELVCRRLSVDELAHVDTSRSTHVVAESRYRYASTRTII